MEEANLVPISCEALWTKGSILNCEFYLNEE